MSRLRQIARELGGVGRTSEFHARGIGAGLLYSASGRGDLVRVRKGWYADPDLGPDVLRAIRVGGALACVSAARHHGLWTPPDQRDLHVAVPAHAVRLRTPDDKRRRLNEAPAGTIVHWMPKVPRATQTVVDALVCATRCVGPATSFVLVESAWQLKAIDTRHLGTLRARVPKEFVSWLDLAGPSSESGTESIFKLLLIELGLEFRQQVQIGRVGRVDFVVGENLVVEVDSREHHSDPLRDRRRDATLSALGYRVLRFMYSQLVYERDSVAAAVIGAVVRGDAATARSL